MNDHVDGWIPELVLGTLDDATRSTVEQHIERCQRCADEVLAMGEALSALALALPPESPPGTLRTEILAAIAGEQRRRETGAGGAGAPGRFAGFVEHVAQLFDVTSERARTLLELLADPAAWTPGPREGISLIHVQPGARIADADAGFVRMAPGVRFPRHRHIGDEFSLVLEGGILDEDGTLVQPGEFHRLEAGTSHDFVALPGEGCLFAVVVGGIEIIEGVSPYGPRDA